VSIKKCGARNLAGNGGGGVFLGVDWREVFLGPTKSVGGVVGNDVNFKYLGFRHYGLVSHMGHMIGSTGYLDWSSAHLPRVLRRSF